MPSCYPVPRPRPNGKVEVSLGLLEAPQGVVGGPPAAQGLGELGLEEERGVTVGEAVVVFAEVIVGLGAGVVYN